MSLEHRHAFNVAVAELMILSNFLKERREMRGGREYHLALETLCLLLAPMAPHISSELWTGGRRGREEREGGGVGVEGERRGRGRGRGGGRVEGERRGANDYAIDCRIARSEADSRSPSL